MKTMTCREMGGMCDEALTAATPDEMIGKGMDHLREKHPEMASTISSMPKDDPMLVSWKQRFDASWDAAPEAA